MKKNLHIFLSLSLILFFSACNKFEHSPYSTKLKEEEKHLTQKNLDRIMAANPSPNDTLKFLLIADTQGFYEETADFVKEANKMDDIDFVLLAGDITDFGAMKEYKYIQKILKDLKMPYLTVVGNHDCLANGKELYKKMFGPFDYSFIYNGYKFIFVNTNYLEFKESVPDMNFLEKELSATESYKKAFVVAHVPPNSGDFDPEKSQPFYNMMKKYNVVYSINGHNHGHEFKQMNNDGIDYLTIGSVNNRSYVLVKAFNDFKQYELIHY